MASQESYSSPGGPVGHRLLSNTIDDLSRREPGKVWAMLPTKDVEGHQNITYAILARAIDQMAWFMKEQLELPGDATFPTVCYIGKPDIRYTFIEMAAAKTRCKVLFSSHINALPAHLNLLEKTDCSILMTATGVAVDDILGARPMRHYIVPELDALLEAMDVKPFPFSKTYEEVQDDPFLILHTSGTTGLPKPITYTHGAVAAQDAQSLLPFLTDEEVKQQGWQRQRMIDTHAGKLTMPFMNFHVIMSLPMLVLTVFGRSTIVMAAREGVGDMSVLMAATAICDIFWGSPRTFADIAQNDEWLNSLSKFKRVICTGGLLPAALGEKLSTKTTVTNCFGTTELAGALVVGNADPEDFNAIVFDPELNGIDWRPEGVDDDGVELYEMVLIKKPQLQNLQSLFRVQNFKDKKEHPMGDVWAKHPTKPHTWLYRGRTDDLICFANGLKYNAAKTQQRLREHGLIEEVLLSGDRHSQTNLLIELSQEGLAQVDQGKESEVRQSLWTYIDQINQGLPNLAKIAKTHIIVAPRDKPFLRSPKGSIRRSATIEMFQADIDECYRKFGDKGFNLLGRLE